jgi:hypothetical protein
MPNTPSPAALSERPVGLARYLATFTVMYVVLGTIFGVAMALLQPKGNANAMGGLAVMLAVMPVMSQFVKRQQRAMVSAERLRFALWATFLIFASSAAAYCLFAIVCGNAHHIGHHLGRFMVELQRYPIGGPILLAFCVLIPFTMLYFATALFGKQALRMQSRMQSANSK